MRTAHAQAAVAELRNGERQALSPKTLLLWMSLLLATASSHKVVESTEDISPGAFENTTALYPVSNNTDSKNSRIKSATSWKIETTFGESTLKSNDSNSTSSRVNLGVEKNNSNQDFKPSPQVGNFFESLEVFPTRETTFEGFSNIVKKPPNAFFGSHKDLKFPINNIPSEVFKNYNQFPYKIESPILTRAKDDWKPTKGAGTLESKPTAEVPVRVPAGSLYKAQDPFKDKPDEDFGLDFSGDFKDTSVKKRNNPWKKLLYLVTSLIPVGLIFSALTPNVITIQPTGSEGQYPSSGNFVRRRADGTVHPNSPPGSIFPPASFTPPTSPAPPNLAVPPTQALPPISERCRRRLLCELQNDVYYARSSRHQRQCHRIPCEDHTALSSTLNYLLNYQQAASAAFQRRLQGSGDTLNMADHFT